MQSGASAQLVAAKKQSTLRALRRAIVRTDGVALRGVADVRNSGFRLDLVTEPIASVTVHDCLVQAKAAVDAVP